MNRERTYTDTVPLARLQRDGVWRGPYRFDNDAVLESVSADVRTRRLCEMLDTMAKLRERDPVQVLALAQRARPEARRLELYAEEGWIAWLGSLSHTLLGHVDEARALAEESVLLAEQVYAPLLYAAVLNNRANLARWDNDLVGAMRDYEWALSAASDACELSIEIGVASNLATYLAELGLIDQSLQLHERIFAVYSGSPIGDDRRILLWSGLAFAHTALAREQHQAGDRAAVDRHVEAATEPVARALDLVDAVDSPRIAAAVLALAGELAVWREDIATLHALLERARRYRVRLDAPQTAFTTLVLEGWLAFASRHYDVAIERLHQALVLLPETESASDGAWLWRRLSEAYAASNRWADAYDALERHHRAVQVDHDRRQAGMAALAQLRHETERLHAVDYLSHDLRGSLTSLRIVLDPKFDDTIAPPGDIPSASNLVDRAVRRLDEFIDFIRASDLNPSGLTDADVHDIVADAVDQRGRSAGSRGVMVEYEPNAAAVVRCHRVMLVRVFVNLIDNAIRFSQVGGRVRIHLEIGDGLARVHVRDSGNGFPTARLFMPFVLPRARMSPSGGYGLGLPFVGRVVEAHGGAVTLANLDDGAEVVVALPIASMR